LFVDNTLSIKNVRREEEINVKGVEIIDYRFTSREGMARNFKVTGSDVVEDSYPRFGAVPGHYDDFNQRRPVTWSLEPV